MHDEYQNYERGSSLAERQQFIGEFTGVRHGELADVRVKTASLSVTDWSL